MSLRHIRLRHLGLKLRHLTLENMSIKRKIILFAVVLTAVLTGIILGISRWAFNRQIQATERDYLNIASKVVYNDLESKLKGGGNSGEMAAKELVRLDYVDDPAKQRNIMALLTSLQASHKSIDYLVVVNGEKQLLGAADPQMLYKAPDWLERLAAEAMYTKGTVVSYESFALSDLFAPDSTLFKRYAIRTNSARNETGTYFYKGLGGFAAVPLLDDSYRVKGAIISGFIVNNDVVLPKQYSDSVAGSFVAISTDGIRLCTNITNMAQTKRGLGTTVPRDVDVISATEQQRFGIENVLGENHIFLDDNIYNHWGKKVGMVGVGIPEVTFRALIVNNHEYVVVASLLVALVMIFAAAGVGLRISIPLIKAKHQAIRLNNMINGQPLDIEEDQDEGTIVLETLNKFSENFAKWQSYKETYAGNLKAEHKKQKELMGQLQLINTRQEQLIADRTVYLRNLVAELEETNKAKASFLGNITHELRTPLNVIIGSAEILKEPLLGQLSIKQAEYVNHIYLSGTHLLQLINDILDVSKITSGKMPLNLATFNIKQVIDQTVYNMRTYIKEKKQHIKISLEPEDFAITADVQKLRQIMYNLLSNAIKFTGASGHISVNVVQMETVAEFTVKDDGIGIAPKDQERVFREFEQVDNSYTREQSGTGLGLPLVKKLVEMHGGLVCLHSVPGKGTEMRFTIPCTVQEKAIAEKGEGTHV